MFDSFFNRVEKTKEWIFEERPCVSGIDQLYSCLFGFMFDFNLWNLGITNNRVNSKQSRAYNYCLDRIESTWIYKI